MNEATEQEAQEVEPQEIQTTEPTAEDIAREGGWRPKEEWEGPPSEWRSAEVFNERGVWIKKHRDQEKRLNDLAESFNTRLDNSNKLHKAQIEAQKAELIRKRDAAIDLADRETANQVQGEIDNLATPEVAPVVNNDQTFLDNWNRENPWILQNTPKAAYAKSQFAHYQQSGQDARTALANAERDVGREFPEINPARENHPTPEGGSKPGGKRGARALTMADLTNEEARIYRSMPGTWASEKDFLKAVQDSRS
jgi:hypothetical protein